MRTESAGNSCMRDQRRRGGQAALRAKSRLDKSQLPCLVEGLMPLGEKRRRRGSICAARFTSGSGSSATTAQLHLRRTADLHLRRLHQHLLLRRLLHQ